MPREAQSRRVGTASRMAATASTMAFCSLGVTTPRPEVTREKRAAPAAAAALGRVQQFLFRKQGVMGRAALGPGRLGAEGAVLGASAALGVDNDAEAHPPAELPLPQPARLTQ